jgi:signal peptidase I
VTFVVRPYSIPSISMIPTLQVHDTVLVDVAAYDFRKPQFGDLAVFVPPLPSHGMPFIKRVIGLPGDTIRIADGVLYRNGRAVSEPYVNEAPQYDLDVAHDTILVDGKALSPAAADIPPRAMWQAPNRIPAGFYLVLGDNRNYSDDSHSWGFAQLGGPFAAGPLAHRHLRARFIGRAVMVLWPLDHARFLR